MVSIKMKLVISIYYNYILSDLVYYIFSLLNIYTLICKLVNIIV